MRESGLDAPWSVQPHRWNILWDDGGIFIMKKWAIHIDIFVNK